MGLDVRNSDFEAQMFFQAQNGDTFLIIDDNIWRWQSVLMRCL